MTRDGNGPAFQAGDAGSTPVAPSRGSPTLSCAGDIWPGITSPQARRSPSRGITGSQGEHIAPLAQLAEQATLNRRVGGSRPSRRTWARGAMLAGSSRAGSRTAYAADSNPVTPEGSNPSSPTRLARPSCESLSGPSLGRNKAVTPGGVKTPGDNGVWGNWQPNRFWPCRSRFESWYSSKPAHLLQAGGRLKVGFGAQEVQQEQQVQAHRDLVIGDEAGQQLDQFDFVHTY